MMRCTLASIVLALLGWASMPAHAFEFTQKFDTRGHAKSQGLWLTVRYPQGWQSAEGERPHIVQRFLYNAERESATYLLQIRDMGPGGTEACRDATSDEMAEAFASAGAGIVVTGMQKTTHENQPAFTYVMKQKTTRAGVDIEMASRVMAVCHRDKMIVLWCTHGQVDRVRQAFVSSDQDLVRYRPMCMQYFNSLVLMDKY